jgi:hypothetical protein
MSDGTGKLVRWLVEARKGFPSLRRFQLSDDVVSVVLFNTIHADTVRIEVVLKVDPEVVFTGFNQ